eukprot:CAMPEP_0114427152 /NCGR_PEP_ID=MMETSP0103-20121206/8186_1 /TAXON_ID=37642 ORGANISM="Paraphysomonas imperforata, Strain PA2" /NCGR_SAMPLE_ID=MMETSP0103 /ASSEMBLY_ACC=CAM_ASM_000201 /LENGTH=351 /DNA_ID=CAMNT_0001596175 /DNA_START=62 /DNA_END=1117 /DNA_ORIENTATION=-
MSETAGVPRGLGRGRGLTQPAWMTSTSTSTSSTPTVPLSDFATDEAGHTSSSGPPTSTSTSSASTSGTTDSVTDTQTIDSTIDPSQLSSSAEKKSVLPQPMSSHVPQPSQQVSSSYCQAFQPQPQHPQYPPQNQYGQYANRSWQPPTATSSSSAAASSSHLDSLLDAIDSKKRGAGTGIAAGSTASTGATTASADSPYDWSKQFDPATGLFYYYNFRTGVTQWEVPEGFIDYHVPPPSASSTSTSAPTSTGTADHLVASSSFNAKTGAFSGAGGDSYWSRVGRQGDREGRQMAAFFDLDSFEQNREEAKRKKQELQHLSKKGRIDWRKHKEEASQQRKRQKQSWLYDDDAS